MPTIVPIGCSDRLELDLKTLIRIKISTQGKMHGVTSTPMGTFGKIVITLVTHVPVANVKICVKVYF